MFADERPGSFRSQVTGEAYSRLRVLTCTQLRRICIHVYMQARSMVRGAHFLRKNFLNLHVEN